VPERLVSALLEPAQLDEDEPALNLDPFSLCNLVQDVVQKFQMKAAEGGVRLGAGFESSLPLVRADIRLIERILNTLIENALNHTPAGGTITGPMPSRGPAIVTEVIDTGPGIGAEDLPHIFKRFYRARPTTGDPGGSGLGLAITQRIAHLHGTNITVASTPGEGATFGFSLSTELTPA
jgi:signal transduction histidine kinase